MRSAHRHSKISFLPSVCRLQVPRSSWLFHPTRSGSGSNVLRETSIAPKRSLRHSRRSSRLADAVVCCQPLVPDSAASHGLGSQDYRKNATGFADGSGRWAISGRYFFHGFLILVDDCRGERDVFMQHLWLCSMQVEGETPTFFPCTSKSFSSSHNSSHNTGRTCGGTGSLSLPAVSGGRVVREEWLGSVAPRDGATSPPRDDSTSSDRSGSPLNRNGV